MLRRPKGYVGTDHEQIGAAFVAIQRILKMPDQVLGAVDAAKLAAVDPNAWYPVSWMVELMDKLDANVGRYGLVQMGRTLFKTAHEERARHGARSARDTLYGMDGMYHAANRGRDIGGWKVTLFEPGHAELEKTTIHHCVMEQGILTGALATVGCPVNVTQLRCFREGADCCVYSVTSSITDARWCGPA